MKLIIQIPCLNEEKYLPLTLASLPRKLEGVDEIEYLVIDDGSTDNTAAVARESGAHHVLSLNMHVGLADAFMAGMERCLELRADIIVNTDADNQYNSDDIQKLVDPIISGKAGMVIGTRPIKSIEHFSFVKKTLHALGSRFVSWITKMDIQDVPSGFRAFSSEAAMRLNIFSRYTYTIESIIQAGYKNIKVATVPIRVNEKLRESRLIKSNFRYIVASLKTVFRIMIIYNPTWLFNRLGVFMFSLGMITGIRFLYYYFTGGGKGHMQSLILLSIFFMLGFGSFLLSVISDLISINRRNLEELQYRLKRYEHQRNESAGKY